MPLETEGTRKTAGKGRVARSREDQIQGEWQQQILLGFSHTISYNMSPSNMHSMQEVAAYQDRHFKKISPWDSLKLIFRSKSHRLMLTLPDIFISGFAFEKVSQATLSKSKHGLLFTLYSF